MEDESDLGDVVSLTNFPTKCTISNCGVKDDERLVMTENPGQECGCERVLDKIIRSAPLFTPYSREVISEYPPDNSPLPSFNHEPYDLFVLRSRLFPYVKKLDGGNSIDILFLKYRREDEMQVTISLMDGGEFYELSNIDAEWLQRKINKITSSHKDYCLLINSAENANPSWLRSLMPFFPIDDKYYPFVNKGNLYINLRGDNDYMDTYDKLREVVDNSISRWYKDGVILLDPNINGKFIDGWKMEKLTEEDGVNLYAPTWKDRRVTLNDPLSFIYNRLSGSNTIEYRIGSSVNNGSNNVYRHVVSLVLGSIGRTYSFLRDKVSVVISNDEGIETAINIANSIELSFLSIPTRVAIIPVDSPSYIDTIKEWVRSSLPSETFTSYVADEDIYVSFSTPLDMEYLDALKVIGLIM